MVGADVKESKRRRQILARATTFLERHRLALIIIAIGIAVLIVLLSLTKSYLAIKFLLGNDLLVEAVGKNTSIAVGQGARVSLPISVAVTANPFCEATCTMILRDIGSGDELYAESFTVRTGDPYTTTREVQAPVNGFGQVLYRHEITCAVTPTSWCHTSGIAVTRDLLVAIDYGPTTQQIAKREELREQLVIVATAAAQERASIDGIALDLTALNNTIDATEALVALAQAQDAHTAIDATLMDAQERWDAQDDEGFAQAAVRAHDLLTQTVAVGNSARNETARVIAHQRASVAWLTASYDALRDAATIPTDNTTLQLRRAAANSIYLETRALLTEHKTTMQARESALGKLAANVTALMSALSIDDRAGALALETRGSVALDALCSADVTCRAHMTTSELTNLPAPKRADACERIDNHTAALATVRAVLVTQAQEENLTANATLVAQAQAQAGERLRLARTDMLTELSSIPGALHTQAITTILTSQPMSPPIALNSTGIEPLIGIALIDAYPASCPVVVNTTIPSPGITPFSAASVPAKPVALSLPDHTPQCCALGECRPCCDDDVCRLALTPPVLFIHGHAFNKGTSAEYSLDAFDLIQRRLESDGWLDTGTLVLSDDARANVWTRAGVPVSTKASYYLDVYAGPDNALLVQTKSESIDTYVLKLNDIIEETQRRTGQDKVIIVAHSMGGLVTRRYLQVFGDTHIASVIMFGTPNNGIDGSIADYCTLLGEDLECRDMRAGSLFLNKLAQSGEPSIPVSIIIGTGCDTDGEDGDGVVTVKNAKLPHATHHYLNGTCDGITTLHTAMLDIDRYPQAYAYLLADLQR